MRNLLLGFAGFFFIGMAGSALAQPAAQLTPDEIVKALTCPANTELGASGTCDAVASAPSAALDSSSSQVEICARPPDVPRVLVRGPDGECGPAKDDTLGFDLGAAAAKGARAAPNANPPARQGGGAVASLTPRDAQPAAGTAASGTAPRLDLLLTFDTDSINLTDQGTANAKAFAEALKRPELRQARFELEGHTDASGTREHNLVLSQKRADAVKALLVSLGVDGDHLAAAGYAFDRPAVPGQPTARENRRVVARRLQ